MFAELEEKIKELDGIISCKITGEEEIDEIHIIASKGRDPKRIVRDIETVVLVNLEREVDHKKISIAQINQSRGEGNENRIIINSIFRENNRPVCHLRLDINGELVEEEIRGSIEEPVHMIVARGMAKTIEKYTGFSGKIRVENVFTTGINDEIVIVQLILFKDTNLTEKERLVGAAYTNHDILLATGKATLKAVNRQLNNYL